MTDKRSDPALPASVRPEPPQETLELCPSCRRTDTLNSRTAQIRCCLRCGCDVTPLQYIPASSLSPRLLELAKLGARLLHEAKFDMAINLDDDPPEGHEWRTKETVERFDSWGFDVCPHPDCTLVRSLTP